MKMVSRIFKCPALGRLRLACLDDVPAIFELVNESMSMNFRINDSHNIVNLIENGILSVCQLDVNGSIVGFLCAREYPLIPSVHPVAWEEYVWTKYKAVELNARNTMFLHLLCWNQIYGRECVDSMLESIFMHDPYVHHVAMVKCMLDYPLLVPGQSRSEGSFRRVQAMERGIPGDQLPGLYVADRPEVCPRLRVRRAVEEDNDDIVPIIERFSTRLRELYGEFYISELISRHPESDRVLLVCEHKELAVGVMCLNTLINYEDLNESFELMPFAGLRKVDTLSIYHKYSAGDSAFSVSSAVSSGLLESASQFRRTSTESSAHYRGTKSRDESEEADASFDVTSILDDDDDDELEFDIVNIATDLLKLPKYLSYDALGKGPAESFLKIIEGSGRHAKKETTYDINLKKDRVKTLAGSNNGLSDGTNYSGTPNAFLLELFAMHPDYDERHGFDMLEAAYELFPNRDYCIVCLPSNHVSFPLLEHFTLVAPRTTRLKFVNQTLYVAHVNSVRGNMSIRPGEAFDVPALHNLLDHAPRAQALLDLFDSTLTSRTLQSYIMLSENQPIGMVVLGPLEDGTTIRVQYDLEPEPVRPGTDGSVLASVISPVLEPHRRWFMRELLRRSQYSTLFWICRLFAKGEANPGRNLMSLADCMVPVHPRISVPNIFKNKILDKILKDVATPFALWIIERPLCSMPKVYVNNSIIVVGASRTGLAFLESLFMGPTAKYLTFSNVTLVSEHGLPTITECLKAADTCVPREGRYNDRYLKSVPFYFYVDVISAIMVGIDRKNKCIHLKGGGVKYYDELVLTCGHQFQHPDYLTESLYLAKKIQKGEPCHRILMDNIQYKPDRVAAPRDLPDNVMLVNSLFEANMRLRILMRTITDFKEKPFCLSEDNQVIVYGDCIEAYSCVAALLELGISPNMIVFVEPFPPEDSNALRVNCFNNETVDERVQANLESLGIRIYRRCYLASWRQVDNRVEALHFMSSVYAIRLPCFALFYYGLKAIDVNAFKAINECGLVYDGGLVVGQNFETNDPAIYGAGTFTRYSRRLYASERLHRYYCSEDVGEALAKMFLLKLDPFVTNTDLGNDGGDNTHFGSSLFSFKVQDSHGSITSKSSTGTWRKWQPVAKYESPIVQTATLPGPLYYMKVRKPGRELPMAVQMCLPKQGHTLITDKRGNYFRLHLNSLHCIDAVSCLSTKPFSSDTLAQVYGKHEAFFNKLLFRFQRGDIDDLYEFFVRPWMSAMYEDSFSDLLHSINAQSVSTVYNLLRPKYASPEEISKSRVESSCSITKTCGFGQSDSPSDITFRSVIDKFISNTSSQMIAAAKKCTNKPRECGQSAALKTPAIGFWKSIGGDRIVISHIAKYLLKHSSTNPHYATPKNEFI
ncbi:cilia- and flagella-associated protein 61 isoform X2 [Bombyx mori]|uniref:cilia- and flagella-associated protein 61 isoform X2 n=1 Tax=Bombyx mori TaxID=7091 RepID=UPI002ED252D6